MTRTIQKPTASNKPPPGVDIAPIFKSKSITGAYRPETWLQLLYYLSHHEAGRKRSERFGFGCSFMALLVGVLFTLVLASPLPVCLMGMLVGIILIGFLWMNNRKRLPEFAVLHDTVLPIVQAVRADMHPHAQLFLSIDLRPSIDPDKQVTKIDHRDARKTIDTFYEDRWLVGRAKLADGSRLRWELIDRLRKRQTTFRRSGGRVKTKTKQRTKTVVAVRLKVPTQRYPSVASTPVHPNVQFLRVHQEGHATKIRLKRKEWNVSPIAIRSLFRWTVGLAYMQITHPRGTAPYTGATRVL